MAARSTACALDVAALHASAAQSSWIQTLGYWPLNVMQRHMARSRNAQIVATC